MENFKIFLVEDDPWYGELLKHHLSLNPDYQVELFQSASSCLSQLHQKPNAVCIDYSLPDLSGEKLLEKILEYDKSIPVIVVSGQGEISVAVELLKRGARDYIIKDDHTKDLLWRSIINIRENACLKNQVAELKHELSEKYSFEKTIIGKSKALKSTFKLIEKACGSNINVSITGETGTGKEVVAKAIHHNSIRKSKPFVAVNMAAIPGELVESELFGHEKGSFTGAFARKIGKFEEAGEGTIFLDEIGELDIAIQSKLLRAIQEREIVRVGGNKSIKIKARIITATHKDLKSEVQEGSFREDFYYRIVGLPIELPPLRNRDNDVLILAKHFIINYAKENQVETPVLDKSAKDKLLAYNFPGNVRELKAIVDLACLMSNGKEIKADDITYHAVKEDEVFTATEKTLKEYNRDIISFFLKKYNNKVLEVAKRLDIGKSTIYNMMKNEEVYESGS